VAIRSLCLLSDRPTRPARGLSPRRPDGRTTSAPSLLAPNAEVAPLLPDAPPKAGGDRGDPFPPPPPLVLEGLPAADGARRRAADAATTATHIGDSRRTALPWSRCRRGYLHRMTPVASSRLRRPLPAQPRRIDSPAAPARQRRSFLAAARHAVAIGLTVPLCRPVAVTRRRRLCHSRRHLVRPPALPPSAVWAEARVVERSVLGPLRVAAGLC